MNELRTFTATRPEVQPLSEHHLAAIWSVAATAATTPADIVVLGGTVHLETPAGRPAAVGQRRRFAALSLATAVSLVGLVGLWALTDRNPAVPAQPYFSAATLLTVVPQTTTAPTDTTPESVVDPSRGAIASRVELLATALRPLGFPNYEYSTSPEGITTVVAIDPHQPRTITVTLKPGVLLVPENHDRPGVTVIENTSSRLRVAYNSNDGWQFTVTVERTGSSQLPAPNEIRDLLYAIDP